jgi:hypothetical protein
MNDLQKELQELKAKVAELESRIVAEPVAKWQPKGGDYYISCNGVIETCGSTNDFKSYGVERATKEQAQRASIEMRRFNRLLALRDELCGDDVPTLESSNISKYFIVYNGFENTWDVSAMYKGFVTPCFKTEQQARRACDMLNSGEVEL